MISTYNIMRAGSGYILLTSAVSCETISISLREGEHFHYVAVTKIPKNIKHFDFLLALNIIEELSAKLSQVNIAYDTLHETLAQ